MEINSKIAQLRENLSHLKSVIVCYSGGIDSAFLLAVANEVLGKSAIGMTAVSPSLPKSELEEAIGFAKKVGATHRIVESNELNNPDYAKNDTDRCFYCKTELYDLAKQKMAEWNLDAVANGTNCDDLVDYRPGLEAAKNAGVVSPLLEAGFTKEDVRLAAKKLGLPNWNKPAAACLSSRLPFGTAVTFERLERIELFEKKLKELGFVQVRVRYQDEIARIEVAKDEMKRFTDPEINLEIVSKGKNLGFKYVTLDLEGYRMGSHNEVLQGKSLRVVA